jgi:hypothetical protein
MSDLLNKIMQIEASKPYIDYNNYHKGNIFGITKSSRWELVHSNFIAWALNPASLRGGTGVVQLKSQVSDADQRIGGTRRYFVNADEVVVLSNNDEVLVSDQWTKEKMPNFIDAVKHIYTITQI